MNIDYIFKLLQLLLVNVFSETSECVAQEISQPFRINQIQSDAKSSEYIIHLISFYNLRYTVNPSYSTLTDSQKQALQTQITSSGQVTVFSL